MAEPADLARPRFGWWPLARRARDFPGFGMPVYAPCDGTVVRVHHRERDHWSRTSPFGLLYMFTVELLRDLFGPSRVLGNHAIIKDADGDYAVLAHLRRGSVPVHEGQHIAAGDRVGECGNSGNSSEPHLHLQVMEHPNPLFAAGVPFRFVSDDGAVIQTPVNGDVLSTPES